MSKATPRGAVAKFSIGGKQTAKKDLAMEAANYGSVYVARVAMGGNDLHTVRAFQEAESYEGPSIVIAYSHCIAHGYDLTFGLAQQRAAVRCGYWPLMRYDPRLRELGKNPFQLDSPRPTVPFKEYAYQEARYTMLARSDPEGAREVLARAQQDVERQWRIYENRAAMTGHPAPAERAAKGTAAAAAGATEGAYR
jgi:pyruvate-ferredoxin/flavodoxin oxidoreductase